MITELLMLIFILVCIGAAVVNYLIFYHFKQFKLSRDKTSKKLFGFLFQSNIIIAIIVFIFLSLALFNK